MRAVRRSDERGRMQAGWLDSYHTFSFGEYHDPAHMGFGPLRVINEDVVAPGSGFPMHGHRDMEIITYILSGALEHRDSLGNGATILPGEAQMMRAGSGIRHSEFNPSPDTPTHLLQIWIEPDAQGLVPSYQQAAFAADSTFRPLAAAEGGAVALRQDAALLVARLAPGEKAYTPLRDKRMYWLHTALGTADADGVALSAGDALSLRGESGTLSVTAGAAGAELLLFDVAPG
jgi:quercetin 2,3-dioxygenase